MININENQPKSSSSKVFGIILSLCLVVAAVVVTVKNGKQSSSQSLKSLISMPDEFTGTFKGRNQIEDYQISGTFRKSLDSSGEWQIDASLKTNMKLKFENDTDTFSSYETFDILNNKITHRTFNQEDAIVAERCLDEERFIPYGRVKSSLESAYDYEHGDLTKPVQHLINKNCAEKDYKIINFEENFIVVCGGLTGKHNKVTIVAEDWLGEITRTDDKFVNDRKVLDTCKVFDPLSTYGNFAETRRTLTMTVPEREWIFNENHHARSLWCDESWCKNWERNLKQDDGGDGPGGGGPGGGSNGAPPPGRSYTKKCLFVHSIANAILSNYNFFWYSTYPSRWGELHIYVPDCPIRNFIRFNTSLVRWEHPRYIAVITKRMKCARTTGRSSSRPGSSLPYIQYTRGDVGMSNGDVVMSHGTGGLIWNHTKNTDCNVSFRTRHLSAGGPWDGYIIGSFANFICLGLRAVLFLSGYGILAGLLSFFVLAFLGLCQGMFAPPGLVSAQPSPLSRMRNSGDNRYSANRNRSMCGMTSTSLDQIWTIIYWAMTTWIAAATDGFLSDSSCKFGAGWNGGGVSWGASAYAKKL